MEKKTKTLNLPLLAVYSVWQFETGSDMQLVLEKKHLADLGRVHENQNKN